MNLFIGHFDSSATPNRKEWLRNSFCFQPSPVTDPLSPNFGRIIGMDEPSATEHQAGGSPKDAFVISITPELAAEFAAVEPFTPIAQ